MSTLIRMLILSCYIAAVYSACSKVAKCEDGTGQRDVGEEYNIGCRKCKCMESRNKLITCYRENKGIFKISTKYQFWMHYYIEVNETEAIDIKCPVGMRSVNQEDTANAQFYINYVLVSKSATCCDSVPRALVNPRTFCKAVPIKGDCENYKLVLKSKTDIDCPRNVKQKLRYLV